MSNIEVTETKQQIKIDDVGQTNVEIIEETISIIKINQGPKGDPGVGGIPSTPPSGGYTIVNFYLNASKKLVVVYDETPVA